MLLTGARLRWLQVLHEEARIFHFSSFLSDGAECCACYSTSGPQSSLKALELRLACLRASSWQCDCCTAALASQGGSAEWH